MKKVTLSFYQQTEGYSRYSVFSFQFSIVLLQLSANISLYLIVYIYLIYYYIYYYIINIYTIYNSYYIYK